VADEDRVVRAVVVEECEQVAGEAVGAVGVDGLRAARVAVAALVGAMTWKAGSASGTIWWRQL
jgi:hypothetical protein